jgi:hypothetical protein
MDAMREALRHILVALGVPDDSTTLYHSAISVAEFRNTVNAEIE